ncbi:MAG TPA: hypothetical protein VG407_19115 [Caulobacteraceae bacterium]|jgi:hypothetical protein|nr:hypothetical protein [Caulobacteraceae bacterium]
MRPIRWIAAIVVLLGVAAQASAASPLAQLKGRWAFNWSGDPARQKCVEVSGELLKDVYSDAYVCDLHETKTQSGGLATDCKRSHPDKDYLIFRTRSKCEAERLTQAANGD